ncbi:hypothetical protein Q7P36_005933 [Cladosporium allicinum]
MKGGTEEHVFDKRFGRRAHARAAKFGNPPPEFKTGEIDLWRQQKQQQQQQQQQEQQQQQQQQQQQPEEDVVAPVPSSPVLAPDESFPSVEDLFALSERRAAIDSALAVSAKAVADAHEGLQEFHQYREMILAALDPDLYEAQQQQSGGSQEDPRTTSAVTPTKSPTAPGDADDGVMTVRPSLFMGSDSPEYVDTVLTSEGWLPFAQMTNAEVINHYGVCSPEGHDLRAVTGPEFRASLAARLQRARAVGPRNSDGCIPNITGSSIRISVKCPLPTCSEKRKLTREAHRWVALLSEPVENAWMMVVKGRISNRALFDASGRCNEFTGKNHCLEHDHVLFESKAMNEVRKGHHNGRRGCFCRDRCFGEQVKRHQPTRLDDVVVATTGIRPS